MADILNLDEIESQVRDDISKKEPRALAAAERLLNAYLDGFRFVDTFTPTAENRLEQVWLLTWNRTFNSLRWAYHHLNSGYYSQSMMLTRSAFEDWLVSEDSKTHPETIDALLDNSGRVPRFQTMADRLEDHLKEGWSGIDGVDGSYGLLSSLTHPRYRSLAILLDPVTNDLRLGPCWDESLFIVGANYLLLALIRRVEFLMMLVSAEHTAWGTDILEPALNEAIECREWLATRATHL